MTGWRPAEPVQLVHTDWQRAGTGSVFAVRNSVAFLCIAIAGKA
jgi:hypothetical protein